MADTTAINLSGKKIRETYKGILHFDSGLESSIKTIYDGSGTKTALSLGLDEQGAILNGDLLVQKSITVSNNSTIISNLSVGGDITLQNGGNINDLIVGNYNNPTTIRALNNAEVGKLRIRESTTDYELIFGNPNQADSNLFSIIVKKDGSNNLYIKNNYNSIDTSSPLWIDRSTGTVNIGNLNVGTINSTGGTANRNTIPPGAILMFPSSTIPQGWLECNGTEQLISDYTDLYSVLQQTYKTNSALDESIKFQLPDLRGCFVRGWDNTKGLDMGRLLGSYQTDTMQPITGSIQTQSANIGAQGAFKLGTNIDGGFDGAGGPTDVILFDSSTITRTSDETRPKNVALVYCIKW